MTEHNPIVVPYGDVVDGVVLRCDCGCGLYESYAQRADAEAAAEEARDAR